MNEDINEYELKVVNVRLVDAPSLFSEETISSSDKAARVVGKELKKYDREVLCVLNLNTKNQVINMNIVSMGTLDGTVAHAREVFKSAILSNASKIMLMHNHPSGKTFPSKEDIEVTKQIKEAGELLNIQLLDHIIVGYNDEQYSFYENNLLIKRENALNTLTSIKVVEKRKKRIRL